jgi:hypothetical protein
MQMHPRARSRRVSSQSANSTKVADGSKTVQEASARRNTSAPGTANLSDADVRRLSNARWASVLGVMMSFATLAGVWAKLRRKQVKGWVLRVFDTFDMLDQMESVTVNATMAGTEASTHGPTAVLMALRPLLARCSSDGTISHEDASRNPFIQACLAQGLDLCCLFCGDTDNRVDFWRLATGASLLYILSRSRARSTISKNSDEETHEEMRLLIGALGRGADDAGASLSREGLLLWVDAATRLGVVRATRFMHPSQGTLLSASETAKSVFEAILEAEVEVVGDAIGGKAENEDGISEEESSESGEDKCAGSGANAGTRGPSLDERFSASLPMFDYAMFFDRNAVHLKAMDMVKQYELAKEYGRV